MFDITNFSYVQRSKYAALSERLRISYCSRCTETEKLIVLRYLLIPVQQYHELFPLSILTYHERDQF